DRRARERARPRGAVLRPRGPARRDRRRGPKTPGHRLLPPDALEGHVRAPRRRRLAHVRGGRAGRDALQDGPLDRSDDALPPRGLARSHSRGGGYSRLAMRTAVVTGGSRGIGRAISHELAGSGARVVLTCQRDFERAEATAEEIRRGGGQATALVMDVLKPDDVKAMAERVAAEFGGAEVLVNNAGVIKDALFPFMREEDWDFVMNVGLYAAF